MSFEEAVTLPLAVATAALGLFVRLGLPGPATSSSMITETTPAGSGEFAF